MTYAIHHNRLLAARMKARCDGTVRMYREKAWEAALMEARQRSALSAIFYAVTQWVALVAANRDRN